MFILPSWLRLSLITILLWGAWGLQAKLIAERISPWMNQVLFPIGLLPLLVWQLFAKNLHKSTNLPKGSSYAFVTGILGGTGNIAFLAAMSKGGKASIVVPWVGLAPLVTVVLARVVLKESLTRAQTVGLAMAPVAAYLLTI